MLQYTNLLMKSVYIKWTNTYTCTCIQPVKFSAISPSYVRYFWQKIPRLQLTFHLQTKFHVYDRRRGQLLKQKFESPSISFLHSPNAYEQDDHLIMDMLVLKKFTTKGKLLVGWRIVGISLVWITLQMDYVC